MTTIHTQCCIAGGGPAGIMLGYLLARAGIDVTVVEKWPDFFRDFRGDTIHPSTMEILKELGLLEEFLQLPHNKTEEIWAHIGGEAVPLAEFSHLRVSAPYIAFIPQWDFLNFLSAKAKTFPNFHLHMETEVDDIITRKGKVIGIQAKSKEDTYEIYADLTIGADGRHSTIREKASLEVQDLGAAIDVLWFRLSRHQGDTHQSLGYADKGAFMVLLDRDDYWQCGYLIHKGDFEGIKKKGLPSLREQISALVPFLKDATQELKSWEHIKLLSVKVDRLQRWYRKGLLCIGDSAHAMSPVGGVGINLAIQDAVATANILIPAFKNHTLSEKTLQAVQRRREFPAKITQRLQILIHKYILEPALANHNHYTLPWQLRPFRHIPLLRRLPARVIGIGVRPEHVKEEKMDYFDVQDGGVESKL